MEVFKRYNKNYLNKNTKIAMNFNGFYDFCSTFCNNSYYH